MEQYQIRISFPLKRKLLLSIVLLLTLSIAFLSISTIYLFKEDKRAYTYQSQITEALLAGRSFTSLARGSLDNLRLTLSSIDPYRQVSERQQTALNDLLKNQNELAGLSIYRLNVKKMSSEWVATLIDSKKGEELGIDEKSIKTSPNWQTIDVKELAEQGYTYFNASVVGKTPTLGLVFGDLNQKSNEKGMPVVVGYVSLKQFSNDVGHLKISASTYQGIVLFDSDSEKLYQKTNMSADPLFKTALEIKPTTGTKEYEFQDEHYLGSFVRPGLNVVILTRDTWKNVMRPTYALIQDTILLGLMAVAAAVVFTIFFARSLTAPLNELTSATQKVASGQFDLNLPVTSKDEIGALSASFNVMSAKINELIQESIEKTRLEGEMAIASTVQQNLLPPSSIKGRNAYVKAHYQSASECGGDWWGTFTVGSKTVFMIADATGHGLPSALITAAARSCFSVMHKLAQESPDFSFSTGSMLAYANRVISEASLGKIMMTFFIAVVDFEEKTLMYSNAGHNPPWYFKNENGKHTLKSLIAKGVRLGENRDVEIFEEHTLDVGPGDILFMYTDGLIEGSDTEGTMYGKKQSRKVVENSLSGGPDLVIDNLMKDFGNHVKGKPLDDDITLVSVLMTPSGETHTRTQA